MFWLILSIVLTIVLFLAICFACNEFTPKAFLSLLCLGIVAFGCFSSVPTGHTGILTTFGAVENTSLPNGINVHAPWQSVIAMSNKEQKKSGSGLAFSKDMQEVSYSYTVNYTLQSAAAPALYKNVGTDYYNIVIAPAVNAAIKTQVGQNNAEGLIVNREYVTASVNNEVEKLSSQYGLHITVIIDDFDFTDVFTNAVEAKQVAEQEKLRAQTEQERMTMEAQQKAERDRINAESAAEIAKINAEADLEVQRINADAAEYAGQKEAAVNKAVSESLTEELIRYQYALRWNGVLPGVMLGESAMPMFNLGQVATEE